MPPPALARLHEVCGGNPLLALEIVRAPGAETTTDVRRLLARRVGALSADTRATLRFVAALAEPTLEVARDGGLRRRGSRRRSPPTCSCATASASASATR